MHHAALSASSSHASSGMRVSRADVGTVMVASMMPRRSISVRMFRMKWLLCVGLFAVTTTAYAQTQEEMEQALKNALLKKSFAVRGFSADDAVHFRWNGSEIEMPSPTYRTLGVVTV